MRRFRFTIIAVCLILSWLAYVDITLYVRNMTPQEITITKLETDGPQQEWLKITDGYMDLTQAINMSGTMDIDSFLIPLKQSANTDNIKIWIETREPEIISALKTYYFQLDNDQQRSAYVNKHNNLFFGQRNITGMLTIGLVANNNREKLVQLLTDMDIAVPDQVLFISEGKEPIKWRGFIFAIIAIAGIMKLARDINATPARKNNPRP